MLYVYEVQILRYSRTLKHILSLFQYFVCTFCIQFKWNCSYEKRVVFSPISDNFAPFSERHQASYRGPLVRWSGRSLENFVCRHLILHERRLHDTAWTKTHRIHCRRRIVGSDCVSMRLKCPRLNKIMKHLDEWSVLSFANQNLRSIKRASVLFVNLIMQSL